jgi:hypothetical protein
MKNNVSLSCSIQFFYFFYLQFMTFVAGLRGSLVVSDRPYLYLRMIETINNYFVCSLLEDTWWLMIGVG